MDLVKGILKFLKLSQEETEVVLEIKGNIRNFSATMDYEMFLSYFTTINRIRKALEHRGVKIADLKEEELGSIGGKILAEKLVGSPTDSIFADWLREEGKNILSVRTVISPSSDGVLIEFKLKYDGRLEDITKEQIVMQYIKMLKDEYKTYVKSSKFYDPLGG